MLKVCTKCKAEKSVSEFHRDKQKADGLSSSCKSCKINNARQYYTINRESVREKAKDRHHKNRDSINKSRRKSSVAGRGQFNKQNPHHHDWGASNRKAYGESAFQRLFRQYKANARRRGYAFDLTEETFREVTKRPCSYCGLPPQMILKTSDSYGEYIYSGVDRIDSSLGYHETNVVACCKMCNRAKTNLSKDDWFAWIQRLIQFQLLQENPNVL